MNYEFEIKMNINLDEVAFVNFFTQKQSFNKMM